MRLRTRQKRRLGNEGYSLTELIIVMAIIVALTALSFVTISLIGSARAKEASVNFDSELSALAERSKSQVCVINGTTYPKLSFCLKIYRDGSKYYAKKGYYNSAATSGIETADLEPGDTFNEAADEYIYVAGDNGKGNKGTGFSSKVRITYKDESGTEQEVDEDGVYIIFNRNGRCISGNGEYAFYKASNDAQIAYVKLNKNGSHQLK